MKKKDIDALNYLDSCIQNIRDGIWGLDSDSSNASPSKVHKIKAKKRPSDVDNAKYFGSLSNVSKRGS